MSRRNQFRPSSVAGVRLEERVVLSAGASLGAPYLLRAFRAPVRAPRASVATLVGLAYDSFQEDFSKVRATYLSSVQAGTAQPGDTVAFKSYIDQRTALLSQEITNSFLVYPKGASRKSQSDSALPILVSRISGNGEGTLQGGSLKESLKKSTPETTATPTSIALNTVAQDDAIEASRVYSLNSVTIVRNGYFGSSKNRK